MPSPLGAGTNHTAEDQTRTKRQRKIKFSLCLTTSLQHVSFPAPDAPWFLGLSDLNWKFNIISSAFRPLNYTTSFLGFPDCESSQSLHLCDLISYNVAIQIDILYRGYFFFTPENTNTGSSSVLKSLRLCPKTRFPKFPHCALYLIAHSIKKKNNVKRVRTTFINFFPVSVDWTL